MPNKLAKLNGGKPMRVVPDVAALADPETGFVIIYKGVHEQFGGTSLACPIFAGIQALASQGRRFPIGFANPLLYTATNLLGGFRDIKDPAPGTLVYATNSGRNLLPAAMDTSLDLGQGLRRRHRPRYAERQPCSCSARSSSSRERSDQATNRTRSQGPRRLARHGPFMTGYAVMLRSGAAIPSSHQ